MINTLNELMLTAESFTSYLLDKKVTFDKRGLPLIPPECYLRSLPRNVVPWDYRNSSFVSDPSSTVICWYAPDRRLLPRLETVFSDISDLKRFQAVVWLDLTVTYDMDPQYQEFLMLLNQLFAAVCAVNGIPVVANLRTGGRETLSLLSTIPHNVTVAAGTLGCENLRSNSDFSFIEKVLRVHARSVIIYGKKDPIAEDQLKTMGVAFRRFPDIHSRYRNLNR